jgi:hypothetical protein
MLNEGVVTNARLAGWRDLLSFLERVGLEGKAMTVYWAAQFLVAAELERRGYFVSFTHENTPDFDLSVTSPTGEHFVVDVEGLGSWTSWLGTIKPPRKNLYYILVFVGSGFTQDRFFILSQSEWNALIEGYKRNRPNDPSSGFLWDAPHKYEGQWEMLPG